MVVAGGWPEALLVGRDAELRVLADALQGVAAGKPCAYVVHGEGGVGKTRLVRDACRTLEPDAHVLWGTCVRFGAASVPFAPLTGAIRTWLACTPQQDREDVMRGLESLLPESGGDRAGQQVPMLDVLFERLAGLAPTILVIDDLHWADRASLDALAYLVTGFRRQRLGLLLTCRDEHREEGHPLHGWLADMRRMPSFGEVRLERLGRRATEDQLTALLGRPCDIGLASLVHERSGGNPYLNELLVTGLTGTEAGLPDGTPAALRDALLATWHGMSPAARQVTRILAVGGRPTPVSVVTAVAADQAAVSASLTEAADHGVVRPDDDGRQWFRHPLLAEVLYDGLPPGEAARIHAAYVQVLESSGDAQEFAADLALHNERAGRIDEAFRWSVVAADGAAGLGATAEEGVHLERACRLWGHVTDDLRGLQAAHVELLRRAARANRMAGKLEVAIALLDDARALVPRDRQPLLAASLLLDWEYLAWEPSGPGTAVSKELLDAVELTGPFGDSPERAMALAELGLREGWDGLLAEAAAHADEAVRVARRSGSPLALAVALSDRVGAEGVVDTDPLADLEEAEQLARSVGATDVLVEAAIWRVVHLFDDGRKAEATELGRTVFEDALEAGPAPWAYFLAYMAARGLLDLGRWEECRDLLRAALAARSVGIPGAAVRLVAAQLAVGTGSLIEARLHWHRARELVDDDFAGLRESMTTSGVDLFLASGRPQQAFDWARDRITAPGAATEIVSDDLLVPFSWAAAEAARAARDSGDSGRAAAVVATLDEMTANWPRVPFETERPEDAVRAMREAQFLAGTAGCRAAPDQARLWELAAQACQAASAPWEEARSRLYCAQALLADGTPAGGVPAEMLRAAHRTAVELGADPLRADVESLARLARVSLDEPAPVTTSGHPSAVFPGLTAREQEILAFLVAGWSNGQIAKHLVISDKTVSVHVSAVLRKTGTSSRVEAAALAVRLGEGGR